MTSVTDVNQLNQGLSDMSLNSGRSNCWEAMSKGYITGDGSRRNWATWSESATNKNSGLGENVGKLDDTNDEDGDGSGSEDGLVSDDYDSDDSQKSHDSRKKNPWLAELFKTLDGLTASEIVEPARQWHCPACRDGPGSIYWFKGMKAFVTHVKTKGTRRPKLHRDLAEILDEELCRRGAVMVPTGETYGQWKGLDKEFEDCEILWPPMVIVMNTQLEQDQTGKWIGIGPQELLEYFESYEAMRARSSFGPEGHLGMSVLIFDTSAVGYLNAERLNNHFNRQGLDRNAWNHQPNLFTPDGKRQLYGFLATQQDLNIFNQHSPGKLKLKYELASYQEKVVKELKKMSKDSQELLWYKKKIAKQERSFKALEDAFGLLSQKLRKHEEENKIVRQRSHMYHEQNKEEMDAQEKFFKDQLKVIQVARDAQKKQIGKSCAVADANLRKEKAENNMKPETKEMEEEREKMMILHEKEMAEMKNKHAKEKAEMAEKFNTKLDQLKNSTSSES
ncbi:protein SUPPRESSOR OF GENE SILENCING 3-like [Bidens hawaiensis]|uniref:protein SUPPRESSOR OF GENE SILENCING 3-like n=1 Tax=Bidens hawaiensis TaxID=980011 RepID=UPI00404992B5